MDSVHHVLPIILRKYSLKINLKTRGMFRLFQDYGSEFECVLLCECSDISKANYKMCSLC